MFFYHFTPLLSIELSNGYPFEIKQFHFEQKVNLRSVFPEIGPSFLFVKSEWNGIAGVVLE